MKRILMIITLPAIAFANFHCEMGNMGFDSPNHGTYLRVTPSSLVIAEARSAGFTAETDAEMGGAYWIHWKTNPFDFCSINFTPLGLTAGGTFYTPGHAYVIAYHTVFYERRDSCEVTVYPVTPRTVGVWPDTTLLPIGEERWINGYVKDSVGVTLYRPDGWSWSFSDSSIVSVVDTSQNSQGILLMGIRPGRTEVAFAWNELSGRGLIIVK